MKKILSVLAFVCVASGAQATTLGFEGVVPDNSLNSLTNQTHSESGFNFVVDHGHIEGGLNSRPANNGTATLLIDSAGFSLNNGGAAFSLQSFDLGQWSTSYGPTTNVSMVGTLMGGGTLTQVVTASGNFVKQTLTGWSNLTSIRFNQSNIGASYDNFVVNAAAPVPVPAGLPLLLAGMGAFGFMARRRKAS